MKKAVLEYLRVPPSATVLPKSVPPVATVSWFAMTPGEVLVDPRLKHLDTRVYGILAGCRRGDSVTIGMRLIAKYCGSNLRRVMESINRLRDAGHVEASATRNGSRAKYRLTAERFQPKAGESKVQVAPITMKRPVTLKHCPKCQRERQKLRKTGLCGHCERDERTRRIAREEIAEAV